MKSLNNQQGFFLLLLNTYPSLCLRLKLKDLLLGETKLSKSAGNFTLVGRRDFVTRDSIVKRRRTTDENLDVVGRRSKEVFLEVVLGDETSLTLPARVSLVNEKVELELLRVLALDILKLLLEQDVILRNVTVEERDLSLVSRVLRDGADELEKRSNTGTTTNKTNFLMLVGRVRVLGNRTLEGNSVVDIQAKNVVTELTSLVSLNKNGKRAGSLKIRNGSVGSNDVAALGSDKFGQKTGSVGETEGFVIGKLKGELLGL